MKKKRIVSIPLLFFITLIIISLSGCDSDKKERARELESQAEEKLIDVPDFNSDSAYYFVQKQVDFGPRVPNTKAHAETAIYLQEKLESYGADVHVQEFSARTFDNETLQLKNIIGSFFPEKTKRILLAAHWDTRPFADKDDDEARQNEPIDGANDGASGVGVLLEIARVLDTAELKPDVGIDIIFFDGEDWGELEGMNNTRPSDGIYESWWALGSQYWSKNKHKPGYNAYYGILLDMVGAQNSTFYREGWSMEYAPTIVRKVWDRAEKLGYGHIFIDRNKPEITDDHLFVNKYAKIPMIDIVHFDPKHGYFGHYHHSHQDNMELISKDILEAVGETVLHTVYYE